MQPSPVTANTSLPRYSVLLASATALAYEILLVRLFSISHWHHYAYMIISLALLGYGISGAFLALFQRRLQAHFSAAYLVNLVLFAAAMPLGYLLAGKSGFSPEEILWDPGQWARLAAIYLYLALPFLFVANAIGLALMQYRDNVGRIYAADLLGAGLGSLGIVALLFMVFPASALRLLTALGIGAAWLAVLELRMRPAALRVALPLAALLPVLLPTAWLEPAMSPYKGLSEALNISGTRVIEQHSSPLGLISVTEHTGIPLRHAPGLSLTASAGPPEQLGIFVDGDGPSAITAAGGDAAALAFLDQLTWALPYHLKRPGRVLILGAGGGSEVLQARQLGAGHIDAVELNPQIVTLVKDTYADFAGHLLDADNVRIFTAEARGFVSTTTDRYDLIQVALVDSFSASSAGLYALSESYLYTVEALQAYLSKLSADGYLAISRWIKMPSRDAPKLFATAITALEKLGIDDPQNRLALIRSWQTSTLLIKNGRFDAAELEALRRFCSARSFDVAYYPGIDAAEVNRFNVMAEPQLYLAARALLGPERERFLADYKFNLEPATDDKPYFFRFFTWRALPEIITLYGRGGVPLLDTGYLILAATLVQAVAASLVLILLPLWFLRRSAAPNAAGAQRWRVLVYFSALGLAFLFLEIAFIQKFILFLHHPLYAVAVVLTAFLLFAGAGSLYSQRLVKAHAGVTVAVAAITVASLVYVFALDRLFTPLAGLADSLRILVSVALIAPLAFFMGMPFPLGITRVGERTPNLIPWAWGINGCASVISAVLATLLAMHFGFTVVVLAAVILYGIAAASMPR
ncbi:MAG: SAM-dependent methyltransferase [Gammaproteobacteria bacterium]|nr:MAG: SAM-dependent methyltransferase [Gammaproteobacteria bacterium]